MSGGDVSMVRLTFEVASSAVRLYFDPLVRIARAFRRWLIMVFSKVGSALAGGLNGYLNRGRPIELDQEVDPVDETQDSRPDRVKQSSNGAYWTPIFVGVVVGAFIGGGSTFFVQQGRISKLEGRMDQLTSGTQQLGPSAPTRHSTGAKPEQLILIIQEQQSENVRESYGELAHQCFTDDDLTRFVQTKTPETITDSLKRDPQFLDVVLAIRVMQPGQRAELLKSVNRPLRPTFGALGRISREGQTEAGQKAEVMIAGAIVNLVKELVNMPEAEFFGLYEQ